MVSNSCLILQAIKMLVPFDLLCLNARISQTGLNFGPNSLWEFVWFIGLTRPNAFILYGRDNNDVMFGTVWEEEVI